MLSGPPIKCKKHHSNSVRVPNSTQMWNNKWDHENGHWTGVPSHPLYLWDLWFEKRNKNKWEHTTPTTIWEQVSHQCEHFRLWTHPSICQTSRISRPLIKVPFSAGVGLSDAAVTDDDAIYFSWTPLCVSWVQNACHLLKWYILKFNLILILSKLHLWLNIVMKKWLTMS